MPYQPQPMSPTRGVFGFVSAAYKPEAKAMLTPLVARNPRRSIDVSSGRWTTDFESVDVGETHVEHDEPRMVARHDIDRLVAGTHAHDVETVAAAVQLDEFGDVGFVVDDDHRSVLHRPMLAAWSWLPGAESVRLL